MKKVTKKPLVKAPATPKVKHWEVPEAWAAWAKSDLLRRIRNGCKAEELLWESNYPHLLPTLIQELAEAGELISVEYTLPGDPTKIYRFLLPKGSVVLSQD